MARHYAEHQLVSSDIEEIYQYIAEDNPGAALAVVRAIQRTLHKIVGNPDRFPRFSPQSFQNEYLRRAIAFPYRNYQIFFELVSNEIRILYVHHAARDFEQRHREEKRL